MSDIREKYNADRLDECIVCKISKKHSIIYKPNQSINNNKLIYLSPGKAIDTTTFFVCQHFILEVDKCLRENNRFSILFSFEDYTFSKMLENNEIAKSLSTIIHELYYNMLDSIYLVDPPFYISPLLTLVKNIYSNTVYSKIKIITKKQYHKLLKIHN